MSNNNRDYFNENDAGILLYKVILTDPSKKRSVVEDLLKKKFEVPFLIDQSEIKLLRKENKDGKFEFSMLTHPDYGYKLNESAKFKVHSLENWKEAEIEKYVLKVINGRGQVFALPIKRIDYLNLKVEDEISCKIKKIYPKKIFFSLEADQKNNLIPEFEYEFTVVDKALVKREDIAVFIIKYGEYIHELVVPKWQFLYCNGFDKILCKVSTDKKIIQVFQNVKHPFFENNKIYNFTFIKNIDETIHIILVKGPDGCHYLVKKPFIYHQVPIPAASSIRLVYKGINIETGNLITKFFVSFEDIIQDFRALKRITFDAFRKEMSEDKTDDDSFVLNKLYKDYDNLENIWVISFCEVLRGKIKKALLERDFEGSLIFIDLLLKVEEWILNSGFLQTFSIENRRRTTKVALSEIDAFKKEAKALELLLDNKEKEFIDDVVICLKQGLITADIIYKTYVFFYLMKHQFIEVSILNDDDYLEILCLIGQNGLFKQELNLYQIVVVQLDRIKNIFEKRLFFQQMFINSAKRKSYYAGNKELLRYIKYTYLSLIIQSEFNFINGVFYTVIRLLKNKGLYLVDESEQRESFSRALKMSTLLPNDIFDKIQSTISWTLDTTQILSWQIQISEKKAFKNLTSLTQSLNEGTQIEARVTGNSLLGYELMYKEDSILLPFFNAYRQFRRGETIGCIIYQIDKQFNQALAKTTIDNSKIPNDQKIEVGEIVQGTIKRFESFGAFVFLGKKDGLIPLREVSRNFLKKAEDILKVGDVVETKVIKIESEGDIERVTLSRREAIRDKVFEKLTNKNYNAIITTVHETYGLFIETENGESGLVRPDEVSWNDYDYLYDLYSEGETISIKYLSSHNSKNYFSLKRAVYDPFSKKPTIKGQFSARIIGLLTFDKWLDQFSGDFRPVSQDEMQVAHCPYCYKGSLYRRYNNDKCTEFRTLEKKVDDRFWSCTNCRFYTPEVIQLLIPDLRCLAEWPLKNLVKRDYVKLVRLLNKNDELLLTINRVDSVKRRLVVDVNLKSLAKTTLNSEIQTFEKFVCQEVAGCYEGYGFLENDLEKKWNYLTWAKYFYSGSKSAKSYYLNVYVNYINILSAIVRENNLNNIIDHIEKIRVLIADIELENNSIETFPVIEKIITLLKVLCQFESKTDEALKYLLAVSIGESIDHDYVKDLASSILSYNLQTSDTNEFVLEGLRNRVLTVLKSSLISFENFENDNDLLKKRALVLSLIKKGEKIDTEFKASIQVPVLSKDVKREIKQTKLKLSQEVSDEERQRLLHRLSQISRINDSDRQVSEVVNLSAMKTIAAFANTGGGFLLIGVDEDEDGNPVIEGLAPDYKKMRNQDGLLRRLDELMQKYFGNSFNSILLAGVDFVLIDGKEILMLNVNKSERPIFLNYSNEKKFYIRRQASTVELSAFELYEYINLKSDAI